MNIAILSLIGFVAILDLTAIFYIGPKTLSSENGSSIVWLPFSFFHKLFVFFSIAYLIHTTQSNWYIVIAAVFYIFAVYGVLKGWGWQLENPWTDFKMDKINIREGRFVPTNVWDYEHAELFIESFFDRALYSISSLLLVMRLLGGF